MGRLWRRLRSRSTRLQAGSWIALALVVSLAAGFGGAAAASARLPPTARAALAQLTVKGRAPKTGYSRARFGGGWATQAGCVTRDRILRRDLTRKTFVSRNSCRVATGSLLDPYTGRTLRFVRGRSGNIDIDHVVSLGDAWQKGAQRWTPAKRKRFANDPLDLLAVSASANRAKGDADAATWLPPRRAFRCRFIAIQIAVKRTYGLWVTRAERDAMARVLATCPNQRLPAGTPAAPIKTPPGPAQVTAGAFCSTRGARGVTRTGAAMVCRTAPGDNRLRWRRP